MTNPAQPTVYDAASQLRRPRQFVRNLRSDFTISRGVAWRLFLRDLRSQHRRSLLGYLWIVLPPLVTAGAWVFLNRSGIVTTPTTTVPYAVYVFVGTALWQSFTEALNAPFSKLTAAQAMLTKFKLPAEAFILIGLAEVAFNTVVRLVLIVAVIVLAGDGLSASSILAPLAVIALVGLGTAIGSSLAPLGTLYGDVQRTVTLIATVWFFLTPIVYSPDQVGDSQRLNPVAVLLVAARDWFFGDDLRWTGAFIGWVGLVAITLPLTFVLYRLAAPYLVDRANT